MKTSSTEYGNAYGWLCKVKGNSHEMSKFFLMRGQNKRKMVKGAMTDKHLVVGL